MFFPRSDALLFVVYVKSGCHRIKLWMTGQKLLQTVQIGAE